MTKTLRTLGIAAALTFGVQANAQLPDYGVYPGGLVLDQFGPGGPVWDIDSILDSGTPVIIDMYAVWCGPCWGYHTGGTLETVYNSIGWGGTGDVAIFGVEADGSEPEADMDGGASVGGSSTQQGDWISGTDYPMSNNDAIASMMNLAYYPSLILVCPDRTVTEVGQASAAVWTTAVNNCGALSASTTDLRITSNETVTSLTTCGGGATTSDFKVVIQNYSNTNITGSKTINVMNGASVVGTANVSVNLDPYEAMLATVTNIPLTLGTNPFNTVIFNSDDVLGNNAFSTPVTVVEAVDLGIGDLILDITMDGYGSEVGFLIAAGDPYFTTKAAAYAAGNSGSYIGLVDFEDSWTNTTTTVQRDFPGLTAGCYHIIMFDGYGDGLSVGTAGQVDLSSPNSGLNLNVVNDENYGYWKTVAFEITTDGTGGFTGVEDAPTVEFATVYPNPAVNMTTVEFSVTESSNVTIQIVNTLGQVVYTNLMGDLTGAQKVQINTADFEAGMYLININVDGNILTKRVSVVK